MNVPNKESWCLIQLSNVYKSDLLKQNADKTWWDEHIVHTQQIPWANPEGGRESGKCCRGWGVVLWGHWVRGNIISASRVNVVLSDKRKKLPFRSFKLSKHSKSLDKVRRSEKGSTSCFKRLQMNSSCWSQLSGHLIKQGKHVSNL